MRTSTRLLLAFGPATIALLSPQSAGAQVAPDVRLATELFAAARRLVERGDFATACPKFAESARLDEKVGTYLNLADCEEHIAQLTNARAHWQKAQNLAARTGDARVSVARERVGRLDAVVPRITIKLGSPPPPGLSVHIDETELRAAALDEALPVDPGRHIVRVTAPGKIAWTAEVQAHAEAPSTVVTVPALVDADEVAPPKQTPTAHEALTPRTLPEHDARAPSSRPSTFWTVPHTVGMATAGLGVAGVVVGTVYGIKTQSKLDDSNASGHCNGRTCDAVGRAARNESLDAASISTGAFVVGGAALVAGAVFFFVVPPSRPSSLSVGAIATPTTTGLDVYGSF